MSDSTYKVVITEPLDTNTPIEDTVNEFAKAFKLTSERAMELINKAPVSINNKADEKTARNYYEALKKVGLGCEIKTMNGEVIDIMQSTPGETDPPPPSPAEIAPVPAKPAVVEEENQPGLKFKIEGRPDYAFVTVQLPANKTLKVEASAMATMDTHLKMKTKMRGGLGRLVSGESIFINEFTAEGVPGEIGIAPGTPGDMGHVYLNNDTIYLQNSAFVAADMDVTVESKWQGLKKGFFSGESFFLIRCSGKGDLWFNTYGAMHEIDVAGEYVVDTGNIVAFTEGLEYNITKVGGYKSLFFSGEGFVCRFSGSGQIWLQTRGVRAFTSWAHWYRPVKNKS